MKLKTISPKSISMRNYSSHELMLIDDIYKKEVAAQRPTKSWGIEIFAKFVETIYLNYPVPPIYIAKEHGGMGVFFIDGQHRLEAIRQVELFLKDTTKKLEQAEKKQVFLSRTNMYFHELFQNKSNLRELYENFINFEWHVVEIEANNDNELKILTSTIFDIMNSTRKVLTKGDTLRGRLISMGIDPSILKNIETEMIKLNYSEVAQSKSNPLNDFIVTLSFLSNDEKSGSIDDLIKEFLEKEKNLSGSINSHLTVVKKAIKYIKDNKIALNKAAKITNFDNSTYIYSAIILFSLFNKENIDIPEKYIADFIKYINIFIDESISRVLHTPTSKLEATTKVFENNKAEINENTFTEIFAN